MRRDDFELPTAPANDRPSDRFQCGSVCSGDRRFAHACALGPTSSGGCRHEKIKCEPISTGQLRARRLKSITFAVGVLILAIGSYIWEREFYKPGPLSTPHAQILSGQFATASCGACHPQALSSPLTWFLSGHEEASVQQSERCMDCHHTTLPRNFARTAHNLSETRLLQIRETSQKAVNVSWNQHFPSPSFSNTDVACATCHREHGGANASLTSLSDAQCQTCHSNRFASFAKDHPPWEQWPYTTTEPIAFDHRSHAERHFPAARDDAGNVASFDCLRCHAKTETGEFTRTTNYATACGTCHDKALNQRVGERLDLFVLPSLIKPNKDVVGDWPVAATGFFDGKVGPLARWILQTNETNQAAMLVLPGEGDFTRINPGDAAQRAAAETLAVAIREAMESMATKGPIPGFFTTEHNDAPMRRVLQSLSPQLIGDATQRWFGGAQSRVSSNADLANPSQKFQMAAARQPLPAADDSLVGSSDSDDSILSDPLLQDSLLQDPLLEVDPLLEPSTNQPEQDVNQPEPKVRQRRGVTREHDPVKMQPDGGWYVDDTRMAISYRGHGHADPVLQAAIELAAGLPPENGIRRELLGSGPAVACVECHRGAISGSATLSESVVWKPQASTRSPETLLTKFAHRPHMNLPTLADCKQCHALATGIGNTGETSLMTSVSFSDVAVPSGVSHDFGPLTKQLCASCHTSAAAGDSCTKCHLYHTEPTDNTSR